MLLRSAIFNFVLWVSVIIYAPIVLLTAPFPFRWRYRTLMQWPRFNLWLARRLCGINYRIEGREHIPAGAAVVMSKHQSAWETLALTQIFPRVTYILKRELMWIPLFGWAASYIKPIAIDRGGGRYALEQIITQGRARLEEGISVIAFPEGTRVAPGQHRPYKLGGALLAAESGYPVIPVALNAGYFWPRRSFMKKPGTVHVIIGPAIQTKGKTAQEVLRETETWIEGTMTRLTEPEYASNDIVKDHAQA